MSIKQWLDSNPLAALVGVAISAVSMGSATTAFLLNQKNEAKQAEISNSLNRQIVDLTTRLSSIERRASPTQDKKYLDVQSMQVSQAEVRALPGDYRSYDNGSFFLNPPLSDFWSYAELTEGELAKLGPFKSMIESAYGNNSLKDVLSHNKGHTWFSRPLANIEFEYAGGVSVAGPLSARIHLMKLSREDLSYKFSKLIGNVSGVNGIVKQDHSKAKEAIKAVKAIDKIKNEASVDVSVSDRIKIKENFERLFAGDAAGFAFIDSLNRIYNHSILSKNISFSLLSAQKQLNVMYIDSETYINNSLIKESFDASCKSGELTVVYLRREMFFVSYGGGGYLIDIEVPSCDGRNIAFDQVTQWLAGLRLTVRLN